MSLRWVFAPAPPSNSTLDLAGLGISSLLARCLANRGVCEPEAVGTYLSPRLKQLSDPFLLPNMAAAVDRLWRARVQHEPIVIFGDYDVDGVTSTALVFEVLTQLGWQVKCHLPQRLDEGYGLSRESVARCLDRCPAALLLALDCGSTATHTIQWLRDRGTDVLVLDHHQLASPLPPAIAVVNPLLLATDSGVGTRTPPFRHLCSVGLAFKLAHALVKHARAQQIAAAEQYDLRPLLDLVALGTIADLVPLLGENRILVTAGLSRLNHSCRCGVQALKAVAQPSAAIGVQEVAFQLAPRLNAAGRLENAEAALQLLLTRDPAEAEALAGKLDGRNRERQAIERSISSEVIDTVQTKFRPDQDYAIVEGQMKWHIGVVGIVASRVMRKFHRPTIIVGGDGEAWRGSGRSIQGFDLAAALRQCDDLLVRHGGHALAAGLTIRPDQVDVFRERLNSLARSQLTPEQLLPSLTLDACVSLAEVDVDRVQGLNQMEPTGQGNAVVQFASLKLHCQRPPQRLGRDQQHAKFWVSDGTAVHEAIWWGAADRTLPQGCFDLAFTPRINEYNGRRIVQLSVLDWRPA